MHVLAKMEGVGGGTGNGGGLRRIIQLVRNGTIAPDETAVVNATGHTIAVEREVLRSGWAKVIAGETMEAAKPRAEGVMSPLNDFDERIHRIAIIEDNVWLDLAAHLQARQSFIDEASNGKSGLEMVKAKQPDDSH